VIFDTDAIRKKEVHFGNVLVQTDWESELLFLDTHPPDLIDQHESKMRFYLKESAHRASLSPWAKNILSEMRKIFTKNGVSLIKFLGFGPDTQSYPWHADKMDVFLVQVAGRTNIRIEGTHCENDPVPFVKGQCVFIPRGTHHEIIPQGTRITYSFGVEYEPDPSSYV